MFKIILALLLMTSSAFATQWRAGTGELTILGTSNASDIDTNTYNSMVKPLDDLLATYCNQYLIYTSGGTITVSAGSVMVSNSAGTVRLMLRNSSTTTVSFSDIDTGAEAPSTTYYIYAIAATTSSTSATYKISASSTAPSGSTYYYQIGSFINDSSSNISNIASTIALAYVGIATSKSFDVTYQALTDGFLTAYVSMPSNTNVVCYTDSSSSPTTPITGVSTASVSTGVSGSCTALIQKGNYYKAVLGGSSTGAAEYFTPLGK